MGFPLRRFLYLIPICYFQELLNASPFYLIVLFVFCCYLSPRIKYTCKKFIAKEIAINESFPPFHHSLSFSYVHTLTTFDLLAYLTSNPLWKNPQYLRSIKLSVSNVYLYLCLFHIYLEHKELSISLYNQQSSVTSFQQSIIFPHPPTPPLILVEIHIWFLNMLLTESSKKEKLFFHTAVASYFCMLTSCFFTQSTYLLH